MSAFDKWTWIDLVLASRDVTDGAKVVGVRMAVKHADQDGRCHPGYQRLADDTGRTRDAVRKSVRQLRDVGFLEWASGSGARITNRYRLLTPRVSQEVDTPSEGGTGEGGSPVTPCTSEGGTCVCGRCDARLRKGVQASPGTLHEPTKEPSINGRTGFSFEEWKTRFDQELIERTPSWIIDRLSNDAESKKDELRAACRDAHRRGHWPTTLARQVTDPGYEGVGCVAAVLAKRVASATVPPSGLGDEIYSGHDDEFVAGVRRVPRPRQDPIAARYGAGAR